MERAALKSAGAQAACFRSTSWCFPLPLMQPVADRLAEVLNTTPSRRTHTGRPMSTASRFKPPPAFDRLATTDNRQRVWSDTVRRMAADGVTTFVEP